MDTFMGQVLMFGGTFAPRGWAFCHGQLLSISQYQALFSLLGTTYGGDGRTTFALPDLRSRVAVGYGQGAGQPNYKIGQKGGEATVTLNSNQMPAHTHTAVVQATSPVGRGQGTTNPTNAFPAEGGSYATVKNVQMNVDSVAVKQTGGNQPHDNMQPYLGMNYIIALEGVYPSRS